MDKFIKWVLKFIFQVLFFFAMIFCLYLGAAKTAKGAIPEPVPGENFQRPLFIDCQNYKIERFKGVHGQLDFTVCYYESYFVGGDGELVKVIIPVNQGTSDPTEQKIILKGVK